MKRKNEKVPEFDEIIFENRNKTYGAYNLRKHYNSATSLSILGGIAVSTLLVTALSFTTQKSIASEGPITGIIVMADPLITKVAPTPEMPKPNLTKTLNNLKPEVTEDPLEVTPFTPSTDDLINTGQNGDVADTNSTVTVVSDPEIPVEVTPRIIVEEMPEYPGGLSALLKFVGDNLKYPEEAQRLNIQGKVFLKFVVNANGSVDRIEITKGVDPLLDSEAVRVVQTLTRFRPGKQGGVPVPVWYALPINFKIENN